MDKFTDAYTKARDVVTNQTFEADWQKFLTDEVKAKTLFGVDGLDSGLSAGPGKLRDRLSKVAEAKRAETLLNAAKAAGATGNAAERAAFLKMLSHIYRASKQGAQDVWVYSPPKAYDKWIFEEIKGTDEEVKTKLSKTEEVYTASDMGVMCSALALASKWTLDAQTKLAAAAAGTKAVVKTWFADADTTDAMIDTHMQTLVDGFKKINAVCCSTKLVISDDPIDRKKVYNAATGKVGWDDWGFVKSTADTMDVIYIQNAFLKAGGDTGKLWKCALTIIHEVSHRAVRTKDNMYDFKGLKPDKTKFPFDKAANNADTWAYFCTDLAGMLGASDRDKTLKVAA